MKIILITLTLVSCVSQPRIVTKETTKEVTKVASIQERIIKCFSYIKSLGANDKFAGEFCTDIYGENL